MPTLICLDIDGVLKHHQWMKTYTYKQERQRAQLDDLNALCGDMPNRGPLCRESHGGLRGDIEIVLSPTIGQRDSPDQRGADLESAIAFCEKDRECARLCHPRNEKERRFFESTLKG